MKIAIASPPFPKSVNDGLYWIEKHMDEAAASRAEMICFPESYIPGYPGLGYDIEKCTPEKLQTALDKVRALAAEKALTVIIPMDWYFGNGLFNLAHVVSNKGEILGYQTKNQLDPTEDNIWVPGRERSVFEVNGVKFGITICHEGFRYPESVRWAAQHGAKIVFHPHCTGSDSHGLQLKEWGSNENPYYEKAMMMRAIENTVFFASSNYGFRYPDAASSIISPDGTCIVHEVYGNSGVIVADIDPGIATGLLAKRFRNDLYV